MTSRSNMARTKTERQRLPRHLNQNSKTEGSGRVQNQFKFKTTSTKFKFKTTSPSSSWRPQLHGVSYGNAISQTLLAAPSLDHRSALVQVTYKPLVNFKGSGSCHKAWVTVRRRLQESKDARCSIINSWGSQLLWAVPSQDRKAKNTPKDTQNTETTTKPNETPNNHGTVVAGAFDGAAAGIKWSGRHLSGWQLGVHSHLSLQSFFRPTLHGFRQHVQLHVAN